jgi:predicted GIY-YIG superfamily endonuclease
MITDGTARQRAAVYRLYGIDDTLIYIGSAYDPTQRFAQHERAPWWPHVARYTEEWHPTRSAAYAAETAAIKAENPKYNIAGRIPSRAPHRSRTRRQISDRVRACGEAQRRAHALSRAAHAEVLGAGGTFAEAGRASEQALIDALDESGLFPGYVAKLRRYQAER